MAAAVRLVRDWAFDDLGLLRVEITAYTDNVASQRVALAARVHARGRAPQLHHRAWRAQGRRLFGMVRPTRGRRPASRGPASAGRASPTAGFWSGPSSPTTPRPYRRAATTPTSHTGSTCCRRRTRSTTHDAFISDARRRLIADESARLAIEDAETGELLGSVGISHFADRQAAEVGYWVKREARRRGVALAAARLVIDWAFAEVGVERLELLTYPGNEASQALAAKLGFTRECLLRGFLEPEPGKSREGRVVPSADGSLPPRDDQVQFVRLRCDPAPED